ncbi:F-box/LRR-repeat protein 13 [Lolium perenne]|uniref:F-box/LRR-repeat protein 13 n=1 Tax=Lolium perenne TaxID=4522 RepID=UPI0021F5FE8C|nr:F-box/LRR-repeat protein 13-like [Lolium perenne]
MVTHCEETYHSAAQGDHADWISVLPDEILVCILSRLPIRDAATTSCLAARWRHLWKSVPKLVINARTVGVDDIQEEETNRQLYEARTAEFIRKVDTMLLTRGTAGVDMFSLWFPYLTCAHANEVDRWWTVLAESTTRVSLFVLRTARKSSREAMGGSHVEPYEFPLQSIASVGSQMRKLCLKNCGLKVAPEMGPASPFTLMACIKLEFVSVTDMEVRILIDLCGALTKVVIICCHRIVQLHVVHARLQHLAVERCKNLQSMRIHAPALLQLRYSGRRIAVDYVHVPLLHMLKLLFVRKNQCPLDCLGALPGLKTLFLQFPSPVAVSPEQLRHDRRFAGLQTIKLLLLNSWSGNIVSVSYLLKACPLIKTLKLEVLGEKQSADLPLAKMEPDIMWPEGCLARSLRRISIRGFGGEPELTELAMVLLRTSPGLVRLRVRLLRWRKHGDGERREHARALALTKLAPRVPSRVKFTVF